MKQLATLLVCASAAIPFAFSQEKQDIPSLPNTDVKSALLPELPTLLEETVLAAADDEDASSDETSPGFANLTTCGQVVVRCPSTPNSTGFGATLSSTGVASLTTPGFTMSVAAAPANRPVKFLYSSAAAQLPFGDGWMCISPYTGLSRLGGVLLTDAAGIATLPLDFAGSPLLNGTFAGNSTWHFQAWFRDTGVVGGTGINTTNALRVTFCP
jgi:hypothetical protein